MKRTALVLGIALAISGSTTNVRAHGGCCFWPFWPLALGAGIAVAAASAHSSPTYVYVPAYPYGYPSGYVTPQASSSPQPTQVASAVPAPAMTAIDQAALWVPSSPGAGHWVPDPTPYNYQPGTQTQPKGIASNPGSSTQSVTITRSVGNVPLYTVTPQ